MRKTIVAVCTTLFAAMLTGCAAGTLPGGSLLPTTSQARSSDVAGGGLPMARVHNLDVAGGGLPMARVHHLDVAGGGLPMARVRHLDVAGGGLPGKKH
jgi:hypothetical protein